MLLRPQGQGQESPEDGNQELRERISRDSRRRGTEQFKDRQGAVMIAAYRPPLPARSTCLLIMRAVPMKSSPDAAALQQAIFESEPKARQYLSEQRQRIGGPGPVPAGPTVGPTPRPSK